MRTGPEILAAFQRLEAAALALALDDFAGAGRGAQGDVVLVFEHARTLAWTWPDGGSPQREWGGPRFRAAARAFRATIGSWFEGVREIRLDFRLTLQSAHEVAGVRRAIVEASS